MSKRILIVDDEENIRRVTRLSLQAAGYEVGEAADGERGLEAFGDGSAWDAVLLDQRMPGMDGLETLRHINERDATRRYRLRAQANDPGDLAQCPCRSPCKTITCVRTCCSNVSRYFSRATNSNHYDEWFHDPGFGRCSARTQRTPLYSQESHWRR